MNVIIDKQENKICLRISGRIDTTSSAQFEDYLQPVFAESDKAIELDCTELSYISSSGLRVFITLLKRVKTSGGSLKILHLNKDISDVFRTTGFNKLFVIED